MVFQALSQLSSDANLLTKASASDGLIVKILLPVLRVTRLHQVEMTALLMT
jgi:hypothetical protein